MNKKEREGELWPISPVVLKSVFDGSRGREERVYEGRVLLLHLLTHLLLLKKEREERKGEKIFSLCNHIKKIFIFFCSSLVTVTLPPVLRSWSVAQ